MSNRNKENSIDISPFNRSSPNFNPDRLVTRRQTEVFLGLGHGVIDVKVSRGDWPLRAYQIGRLSKLRVGDVLEHFIPAGKSAT